MARNRKRWTTRPKVRGKLREIHERDLANDRASKARRRARAEALGWRVHGCYLALPDAAERRIEEYATQQGVPKYVVVGAMLTTGLPYLSAAKLHAFWKEFREAVQDGPGYRAKLRQIGHLKAAHMNALHAARRAARLDSGIARTVPTPEEAASG